MGFFASSGILNQRGFFSPPTAAEAPPPPPPPSGITIATTSNVRVNYSQYPFDLIKSGTFTNNNDEISVGGIGNGANFIGLNFVNGKFYFAYDPNTFNLQFAVGLIGPSGGIWTDVDGTVLASFSSLIYLWAKIEYDPSGDGFFSISESSTNSVASENIIPTSGWSPSITITAA